MNPYNRILPLSDPKSRWLSSLIISISLIFGVYFVGSTWLRKDFLKFSPAFALKTGEQDKNSNKCEGSSLDVEFNATKESMYAKKCNDKCRPIGTEALPKGIISVSTNLEMQPLWGPVSENVRKTAGESDKTHIRSCIFNNKTHHATHLLAIAVGIDQKRLVNQIVKKFLENDFVVMLFHYDGVVEKWNDLEWSNKAIHVSVLNQTKWWFAKRFLHPDIVADYEYIFLWDEDLRVDNFHPGRYLSIVKEEGLEISQPALDPGKSEVHHPITVRRQRSRCHRRYYKFKGGGRCNENSTAPPCVGWVEMMAPVFSRAAWRCAWYLIQNDLIHAWGMDRQLGYCAQGDRTVKVGVVDQEYIVHLGLPTLGGFLDKNKTNIEFDDQSSESKRLLDSESLVGDVYKYDNRSAVRIRSYIEMGIFKDRWNKAVKEDGCWLDPFQTAGT